MYYRYITSAVLTLNIIDKTLKNNILKKIQKNTDALDFLCGFVARTLAKPQAVRSTAREQVAVGRIERKMRSKKFNRILTIL